MLRRLLTRALLRARLLDDATLRRALYDELTGLQNRVSFHERLRDARRAGVNGSVVICDIDLVKQFNDRYGHQTGDALVRLVAQRLKCSLPETAEIARIGGDEFIVFLPRLDVTRAQSAMRKCMDDVREPIALDGAANECITLSAGLTEFTGQSMDDVLRACDVAMYAAKAGGRDQLVVFDDETRKIVTARRELATALVELQQRNRALHDESRTDVLTGLRNLRALEEILSRPIGGDGFPCSEAAVAFVDVDCFSNFNHVHSDARGDEALRAVAAALRRSTRDADLIFRKGGEEFVAVLPGLAGEDARAAGERLRSAVEGLAIEHPGSSVAPILSVTVGVASAGVGPQIRDLVTAADKQAMAAKLNNQRNQVHCVHLRTDYTINLSLPGSLAGAQ